MTSAHRRVVLITVGASFASVGCGGTNLGVGGLIAAALVMLWSCWPARGCDDQPVGPCLSVVPYDPADYEERPLAPDLGQPDQPDVGAADGQREEMGALNRWQLLDKHRDRLPDDLFDRLKREV